MTGQSDGVATASAASLQHDEQGEDLRDLAAARLGDSQAFARLVERHEGRVAATVIGMLGEGPEAEDVGQEVFIRLHAALHRFRQEARLSTYITRIAINLSLDRLRARQRLLGRVFGIEHDELGPLEPAQDAGDLLDARERARLVRRAVRQLRPAWRAVVVLRLLQGYSTLETAELLGVPKGTVLSRLARASAALREHLGPLIEGWEAR